MKLSFHHLKFQIQSGLLEAEDVFASLAVPLMKLVGLKSGEMAEEGRISMVVIDKTVRVEAPLPTESQYETNGSYKDDGYMSKATLVGKELVRKQRHQTLQLVHLLKQIETQVNSSHNNICQTISDHRTSMQRIFQKIMAVLVTIHPSGAEPDHYTLVTTAKLLQSTFERVNLAFDSIEGGVEDLFCNLGQKMCAPMMGYAKNLKAEMTAGSFPRLLAIMEKLGGELRNKQLELDQERRKVREAEDRKVEALNMLKKSEENIQKMKDYLSSTVATIKDCREYFAPTLKGVDQDQVTDERLLWELVNKKRKYESPLGPQELNCIGFNNYNHKSKRVKPQMTSRPITRSYAKGLTPKTPCSDSRPLLGSSPSVILRRT